MILEFYNLREQPFGVTPDPRYLYMSPTHREAIASLEYGIASNRGFLGLIAPPGMGKTTILFQLLQWLGENARTVFIFQSPATPHDFLRNLMTDLDLGECGGDLLSMQSKLNHFLMEEAKAGRRVVVVVDEAQNLEDPVLEHLRMLSNFETARQKLIQIVLSGQTQLAERLASPSLVQLRQRISMMARLAPFDLEEAEKYVNHRLEIAGYNRELPLFTRRALRLIAESSGGIPRNINNICFNALSLGCVNQQQMIPADSIQEVVKDLDLGEIRKVPSLAVAAPVNSELHPESQANGRTSTKRSAIRSWLPRLTAAALLLSLGVMGIASFERMNRNRVYGGNPPQKTETPAATAPPQITGLSVPESPVQTALPRAAGGPVAFRSIQVGQDQTLYSIAVENLGSYSRQNVQLIQELNPWLTNPDHIQAGQTIRIPKSEKMQYYTRTTESIAEAGNP